MSVLPDEDAILLGYPSWGLHVNASLMLERGVPLATNATAIFYMEDMAEPVTLDVNEMWDTSDPALDTETHLHIGNVEHYYTKGGQ